MDRTEIWNPGKTIFISLALIIFISIIILIPACKSEDKPVEEINKEDSAIREATVEKRDISSKINLSGIALAGTKNSFSFEIGGDLLFIESEGNTVKEGGKLAELDGEIPLEELEIIQSSIEDALDLYEYELLMHQYAYENIEIEIELATYYYYHESQGRKPDRLLFEQQLLALEEQRAQADFELSQKEDELHSLQEEYEDSLVEITDKLEIIAPYDCLVKSVSESESNKISADQQVIEVIDPDSIIIRADLPETDKNRVKENMEVNIFFNSYPDNLLKGKVFIIEQIPVNTDAGTFYEIFIEFMDLQGIGIMDVYGLKAELEIIISGGDNILVVPVDYVYNEGSEKFVYKITGEGKFEKTYIETGVMDLNYIEIVSGLDEGDRIMISQ